MAIVLDGTVGITLPASGDLLSTGLIQSDTSSPPVIKNSSGTDIGTFCRAWVNFNGTGTVAIRASFNVSSITDLGVGLYTVNFTTGMPDASYSAVSSSEGCFNGSLVILTNTSGTDFSNNMTASACTICLRGNDGNRYDVATLTTSFFR
jgi:hypothetical protein